MTNKSFPVSEKRATEPFELIHSDLKSFPVESYQEYKYSIVFYDDYTSHVWTIDLRTKDAAPPATKTIYRYGRDKTPDESSKLEIR